MRQVGRSAWAALLPLGTPVIVLGGILRGVFTPTAAAGPAIVHILVLGVAHRSLTWLALRRVVVPTAETTGSILLIVASASLFGWVLARERTPQTVAEGILSSTSNPIVFLTLVKLLLLCQDHAVILVLGPHHGPRPAAGDRPVPDRPAALRVSPIHNLVTGLLAPPIGGVLYVRAAVTDIPFPGVVQGCLAFVSPLLLVLVTDIPAMMVRLPHVLRADHHDLGEGPLMDFRFDDRTVLVTGASTGIGAALATAYGASGARVAVHYGSSADAAAAVVQRVRDSGGEAWAVQADLADQDAPQRLVEQVQERYGRVDVLVNNAGGLLERRSTGEVSRELYDAVTQLNLASVVALCGAVVPAMRDAGCGAVLNVSSVAAVTGGGPGASLYAAAKGAVVSYTRALAKELAPDGVRVNCLSPGVIDTPFHERYTTAEGMAVMVGTIPMGRSGTPEECVGAALFLTHEGMSGYVTGQVLAVNGGQHFLG